MSLKGRGNGSGRGMYEEICPRGYVHAREMFGSQFVKGTFNQYGILMMPTLC